MFKAPSGALSFLHASKVACNVADVQAMENASIHLLHSFAAKFLREVNPLARIWVPLAETDQVEAVMANGINHVALDPGIPFLEVPQLRHACFRQADVAAFNGIRSCRTQSHHRDKTTAASGKHNHRPNLHHFRRPESR